jgi:transcriptional regulator with XRE-family HTH domain
MTNRRPSPATLRRLSAVLALRGTTVSQLATKLGISDSHLRAVVIGERRGSERLLTALQDDLGSADWQFVRGLVDVVSMSGARRIA